MQNRQLVIFSALCPTSAAGPSKLPMDAYECLPLRFPQHQRIFLRPCVDDAFRNHATTQCIDVSQKCTTAKIMLSAHVLFSSSGSPLPTRWVSIDGQFLRLHCTCAFALRHTQHRHKTIGALSGAIGAPNDFVQLPFITLSFSVVVLGFIERPLRVHTIR